MNKALQGLGLAMRAGKLVSGEAMVEKAIKELSVKLVIVAEDASDNTKKRFTDMCAFRQIELIFFNDKASLGKALGKDIRATIGILDESFVNLFKSKIMENNI